jgi:lipoyl(octanoyl) transferase
LNASGKQALKKDSVTLKAAPLSVPPTMQKNMSGKPDIQFRDLGLIDYKQAWDYQEELFASIIEKKLQQRESPASSQHDPPNHLLFCEHPHVFTMGKSGDSQNLLMNMDQLKAKDAQFFRINRGGDITYHGPGQIVGYPVLDLAQFNLGIRRYINILEEAVIQVLKDFSIDAGRLTSASGVWLDKELPARTRKICAIGVRASRGVTMHGFAFNVNTDLSFYQYINPCGFTDKSVTSMQAELGKSIDMAAVKEKLKEQLLKLLFNT